MTVLAKTKSGVSRLGRHRDDRGTRAAAPREPRLSTVDAPPASDPAAVAIRRRRREAAAPQDAAMYTCECGFQFAAQVSTSVGCPHCGGDQAW